MNKIDLIIPTHNRTEYLKRVLDYYQKYGNNFNFNFIIADSSNPTIKRSNKELIKNYSELKILYVDKFSDKLIQSHKFAEMVEYADSKYVCFCADDDFIIPKAIKDCIDFLEKNPDYIGAHGTYIGFHLFKNFISNQFWWQFRHSPISITSSDYVTRLVTLLTTSSQILWAVKLTKAVKYSYRQFKKIDFDPSLIAVLGELLPDSLTILQGKIKNLDTFYSARQYYGSVINYYSNFKDAQNKNKYNDEYDKFKNCILKNLSMLNYNLSYKSSDKIIRTIDSAMEKCINNSYQQYLINKLLFILRRYPRIISKGLLLLNAYYLTSKEKKSSIGLIDNPSSKFFNDFEAIRLSVLKTKI